MRKIILASASPRRQELLHEHGVTFEVYVSGCDESYDCNADVCEYVQAIAERKAVAALGSYSGDKTGVLILAADTAVAVGGKILGKPADDVDAIAMLRSLSGSRHKVCTGVCVIDADTGAKRVEVAVTYVTFKQLTDKEIQDYINTREHEGKAGAYAIQGEGVGFVERIEGSFDNVVGLPVELALEMLK